MNILAVDTAGKSAAVAILRDDTLLYETQCNNGMTHSETLLPMIDTALRACGLTMEDIDLLGVTSGPGSFTGLRIGLSVVTGLAQLCATIVISRSAGSQPVRPPCRCCGVPGWRWPPKPCGKPGPACRLLPCCRTTTG